jgi:probable rRNA maturation factor
MTEVSGNLSITNTTRGKLPSLPFEDIKKAVVGDDYVLSIVFATTALSHKLNKEHRGKDKPTNILSFPLSGTEGEIYICPSRARDDAKKFGETYEQFLQHLLIHGLLHLKGYVHGSTMEREESRFRKMFGLSA